MKRTRTPAGAVAQIAEWAESWAVADLRRIEKLDGVTMLLAEVAMHGFSPRAPSKAMVKDALALVREERALVGSSHIAALLAHRRVHGSDAALAALVASLSHAERTAYEQALRASLRAPRRQQDPPSAARRTPSHFSVRVLADLLSGERTRRPKPALEAARLLHTVVEARLLDLAEPPVIDLAHEVRRRHVTLWRRIRRLVRG